MNENRKHARSGAGRVAALIASREDAVRVCPVLKKAGEEDGARMYAVTADTGVDTVDVFRAFGVAARDTAGESGGRAARDDTGRLFCTFGRFLDGDRPDAVLVSGGGEGALAGAFSAFYRGIPVIHLGAGVRTETVDTREQLHHRAVTHTASLHLTSTELDRIHLQREDVSPDSIAVTGSTVADAAVLCRRTGICTPLTDRTLGKRVVLVMLSHLTKTETVYGILSALCRAVEVSGSEEDASLLSVAISHSPALAVSEAVLSGRAYCGVASPLPIEELREILSGAYLCVTDIDCVMEAAAFLGVVTLACGRSADRPQAFGGGVLRFVGDGAETVFREARGFLAEPLRRRGLAAQSRVFGDGDASRRVVSAVRRFLSGDGEFAGGSTTPLCIPLRGRGC